MDVRSKNPTVEKMEWPSGLCGGIMPQVGEVGKRILKRGPLGARGPIDKGEGIPVVCGGIRCSGQQQCPWAGPSHTAGDRGFAKPSGGRRAVNSSRCGLRVFPSYIRISAILSMQMENCRE